MSVLLLKSSSLIGSLSSFVTGGVDSILEGFGGSGVGLAGSSSSSGLSGLSGLKNSSYKPQIAARIITIGRSIIAGSGVVSSLHSSHSQFFSLQKSASGASNILFINGLLFPSQQG